MDKKEQTIHTYNTTALALAEKFDNIGVRTDDIAETFALIEKENPFVLEIGCGNGRDAQEILKYTHWYKGVDISEKLIEIAKQKVPNGIFEIADLETYVFPECVDVVFAFASLIHTPREILKNMFTRLYAVMSERGLVRLSMKYADEYVEVTKTDEFGTRIYYLYSQTDIQEIVTPFVVVKNSLNKSQGQIWVEMILRKE